MPSPKPKILIIEDDHITGKIYSQKFMMEGFQVDVALDGEAGILKLTSFKPDLVLLDLMLPKVNGVEVLKNIRGKQAFQDLPVIVFSNAYLSTMVQDAWEAGATKVLTKVNHTPKQVVDEARGALALVKAENAASEAASQSAKVVQQQSSSPPAPAISVPTHSLSHRNSDAEFEADLRRSFVETASANLDAVRHVLVAFTKTPNDMALLHELYRKIHSILGTSALAGFKKISKFCSAVEAFLKDLYQKPDHINPSTIRTLTQSIDFVGSLMQAGAQSTSDAMKPTMILIVDDDEIARRAIGYSLEKADLKSVSIGDATTALKMLTENQFDLVFLDVDLPDMSGFDICTRLRMMQTYRTTPVVFITSHDSTPAHARGVVSGGNDFITKPFLYMELAVKSLMLIMKSQLNATPQNAQEQSAL
jgi:DNA-binding response OmpR family regulator